MKVDIYSLRSFDSLFNGMEIFCVVMMTLRGGRAIITLRAPDRDRVKWSWEVTCCYFILSLHSAGGGMWVMTGCCDNVWDLLTSVNDPDHYIRMDYVGHPDISWKPSGCFMLISVIWPSLRQAGYEGASCVSGWDDLDGMRATCHYEVCGTCSQEEGSLQNLYQEPN